MPCAGHCLYVQMFLPPCEQQCAKMLILGCIPYKCHVLAVNADTGLQARHSWTVYLMTVIQKY